MRKFIVSCIFICAFFGAQCQGKKIIKKVLYAEPTYQRLLQFKLDVVGNPLTDLQELVLAYPNDPNKQNSLGYVIEFLSLVAKDPDNKVVSPNSPKLTVEKILLLEKEYNDIAKDYNSLISIIQSDVESIADINGFRTLNIQNYNERLTEINSRANIFKASLRQYYNLMFVDSIVFQFAKFILNNIALRIVKNVIISELDFLKLAPLDWGLAVNAVRNVKALPNIESSLESTSEEANHAQILMITTYPYTLNSDSLNKNYNAITEKYKMILKELTNNDDSIKEYFQSKLVALDLAKKYFDSHPELFNSTEKTAFSLKEQLNKLLAAPQIESLSKEEIIIKLKLMLSNEK